MIPAAPGAALDAADEAVDLLLDSGRPPGDVLVLTTGEPHPWAAHELSFGEDAYWKLQSAGDDGAASRALTAAMQRAGALLVLCGDPKRINSLAGAGV